MAVDWSKYGIKEKEEEKKASVDWSKYNPIPKPNPDIIPLMTQSATADPSTLLSNAQNLIDSRVENQRMRDDLARMTVDNVMSRTQPVPERNKTIRLAGQEFDVSDYSEHPSRDIPVVGSVLKGLDRLSDLTLPASRIAGELYTPGAGLANLASATGAVGTKAAQIAPKLAGNSLGARVAQEAIKEGVTGAPIGAMIAAANDGDVKDVALSAGIGAGMGAAGGAAFPLIGAGIGKVYSKWVNRAKPQELQPVVEMLALPSPKPKALREGTIPSGETIYASGEVYKPPVEEILSLPASNYKQTRLKVAGSEQTLDSVMKRIKPIVTERMTPPLENPNELAKWVKTHLGDEISLNEVRKLPYEDLRQMAEMMRPRISMTEEATRAARELGYDLNSLLDGRVPTVRERAAQNLQKQAYGIYPESPPKVRRPEQFAKEVTGQATIRQGLGFAPKQQEKLIDQSAIEQIRSRPKESIPDPPQAADDLIQTKEPRIRDKVVSYLDEQEKAARERLKAKRTTLSSNPIDQYADYAIILAAKAGKGAIKLADATEFLVKEFGEEIRPHVQAIVNRAKNIAKEAEKRATKEAESARVFNNADTGDASTFRSKINRDPKSNRIPFSQRWEKLRTQFVDDLAPLEGLEKRVRGSLSSAEDSLYKSARLFRGVPEKANAIVKNRLAPIINGIEKQGYTSADLGDYALAVHARDVNALDMKSGWTNREIDSVIEKLGTPEMERARKAMIRISDDLLSELEKSGVVGKEAIEAMREKYPNYMPLFRSFDDESVEFSTGLSKALANVTSPIKSLKGSERKVDDPFINMVKNIFQSTNAAERNKVATQLSKLAKDDVDGNFIRKLDDTEKVGRKNVVSVLENGQKVRYEVEPEVYKAMLNLDQESSNTLIKILQKPASLLRAGATLTPEFSLRNPLRDIVQAFVVSESGFNPLIDFPVGLIQSISKGNLYKQWVDELGAYGNIMSNDRQVHKEALERVLKESPGKKFVNVVNGKSLISLLRAISDTTESATKVGEFRAALRKGASPQEAAYRSRDIMDFGRAGTSIRQTNKIVAFLNANIQGKSKLIRAFKANPAGFTARAFTSVTVPTIGAFLMQKYMANDVQKQTIEEAPTWMTDTFWLIPIPNSDQVARIPKPFDLSTLFSNLPERALKYTYNNDRKAFDGFAKKAMADASMPGMITGLLPFIEGMANYSFFQGRNIIPRGEEGRKFEDQYDINTTETAKFLAKGAEKLTGGEGTFKNFSSPRIMDNTIRGLTAGLGSYATSAIDVLLDKFNVTDNPVKPEKSPAQKPLQKAFLVNELQGGKSVERLYELKDELTREKGSAKLNKRPFKDEGRLKAINTATERMSEITKQIRNIENSRTLTATEKRVRIENLIRQRNKIARDIMSRLEPN